MQIGQFAQCYKIPASKKMLGNQRTIVIGIIERDASAIVPDYIRRGVTVSENFMRILVFRPFRSAVSNE